MSNEIVKFSNQFNNVALKKFDAVHLDVLMAIASRVREKGTATVEFSFEELRGLMRLRKNLTNKQLADKIVQTNARLLALNYMFEDSGKIIQFALFTKFVTDPQAGCFLWHCIEKIGFFRIWKITAGAVFNFHESTFDVRENFLDLSHMDTSKQAFPLRILQTDPADFSI